eukprot:TRINITY_DN1637_c0_g1_i1.p1 TRINITY_DN1637_c0_g1~~TRINITY_DN1637_c0_g1_i1.p1  ORF type:complete len:1249 (-),score=365.62 TRINITY_DN1637_c0_g1_i1:533-4279(-)
MNNNNNKEEEEFPLKGLLPKEEIGSIEFQEVRPKSNGNGIIVAIFDTGIDPGAPGLQTTCEGKPKIIDLVDGTGSGDVNTTLIVESIKEEEGEWIKGWNGRKLYLNEKWKNPSGKWHIGFKRCFELFSNPLTERIKKERRKSFDLQQRRAKDVAFKSLSQFDSNHPNKSILSSQLQKQRRELEDRLNQLDELEKDYQDEGPVFDVVSFHDGDQWNAIVNTEEAEEQFASAKVLRNFRDCREFSTISKMDLMNYSINIYDDGNLVSIVTDCSPHGTHVAGIVGAYHPTQPELNGIAPGVQLISVKIGDTRLGSEEVGSAIIRGLIAAKANGCHIINMSYGEAVHRPNVGRTIELIKEFVEKHNIIFVSSGGNNGPGLSTVGAPGGTSDSVIGVGAYVSSEMMPTEYSLREKLPDIMYTWSSRGPAFDGHRGISVCAPGGAFSAVPNWTLKKYDHMNGTSMSSPNCCGGIALLLSALKQEGIFWRPHLIKRALENTAKPIKGAEPWAVGCGCIQVTKAFDWMMKSNEDPDLQYELKVKRKRGIYLKSWEETQKPLETTINVSANWHESSANDKKIKYERRIVVKSTVSWISTPQYLVSVTGARNLNVRIDPTHLDAGKAYYAEIQGFDSQNPSFGPLFRLPVTIIKPFLMDSSAENASQLSGSFKFNPGEIQRIFVQPPKGSSSAEITVRTKDLDTRRTFSFHAQQMKRHIPYRNTEVSEFFALASSEERKWNVLLRGDLPLEVGLGQFWSSLGSSQLDYRIQFSGISCETLGGPLTLNGNSNLLRIDVSSTIQTEDIKPSIELKSVQKFLRPFESSIKPLQTQRDQLPEERNILQLVLQYKLKLEEKADGLFCFISGLSPLLYDSPFETQYWMIFDSNKALIGCGDSFSERYSFPLSKGDYIIRVQLRHESKAKLEKHKELILGVQFKASDADKKGLDLKFFSTQQNAILEENAYSRKKLQKGKKTSIFIKGVGYPSGKNVKPGDIISGLFSLQAKIEYDFHYIVPAAKIVNESKVDNNESSNELQTEKQKLEKHILDQTVSFLSGLLSRKQFEDFRQLSIALDDNSSNHLPLLQLHLHAVDNDSDRLSKLDQIILIADKIIAAIDVNAMAIHYGTKSDESDPSQMKKKREWDSKKEILIDALYRKGLALSDKNDDAESEKNTIEFKKWADDNPKFTSLEVKRLKKDSLFGTALKITTKQLSTISVSDPIKKELLDQQIELVEKLGWDHWKNVLIQQKLQSYPSSFANF